VKKAVNMMVVQHIFDYHVMLCVDVTVMLCWFEGLVDILAWLRM